MKVGRPKIVADIRALGLSAEEGFVASRIDGQLSVADIAALTGMDPRRVSAIVERLEVRGAVRVEAVDRSGRLPDDGASPWVGEKTSLADYAAAFGIAGPEPSEYELPEPADSSLQLEPVEDDPSQPEVAPIEASRASQPEIDEAALSEAAPERDTADIGEEYGELEEVRDELEEVRDEPEEQGQAEGATEETATEEEKLNERNYRELYEKKFHPLPADARIAAAKTANGADLIALCFDADPRVIHAVLENHGAGLEHARMIAGHHRTKTGIEMVSRRAEFLRDALVERRLLRNPQIGDVTIGRVLNPKRIGATYKIAIDRDIPELTRIKARAALRKKWQTCPPEDRAELVLRTDGRCLSLLIGCAFDAKSTQIICSKQVVNALLIVNFAKFPATPPTILAHFIKQNFVRRNPGLRKMLLQHPNMPGDVKRQFA